MEAKNQFELHQLQQIKVESIDLQAFLQLVHYIEGDKGKVRDRDIFKAANNKLTEFSKTYQAWGVCLKCLESAISNPSSSTEFQQFHAANMLKNKMMIDFGTLKFQSGDNALAVAQELRQTLILILSQLNMP